MNNEKWNHVLIEWVNCLKLCKNINGIEELRNGEFFSNLQKVITKSRNAQLDILTFIFDLFSKHYPNYSFDNKTEIHLSDLPEPDLKALTSLLMHYTCIYDRKDVLTSPLCHSLSQSTQLIIRNFLQKLNKEVTNDTMNTTIKSCIDDASDHSANNQWLSVDTSSCKNSPLQDLLKTPMSRFGRLQEKDRIIAKLKTELDAERFDKAELQEDLKRQIEKNNKVEQQIAQKNNEVLRLRAEVVALENRTPPHYQDMDSRELQRRLRSEIQSLEQYIKQIENEQDVIMKEKDAAKEQVRKLESQSQIWEEKFFETERNFEMLKEQSKQQEEELLELKAHCSEITALLEEYRTKPEQDSSLYDTFTSIGDIKINETVATEDLACSVVEVQLRDAQKLNEELKIRIRELEEKETRLNEVVTKIGKEKAKEEERNQELLVTVHKLQESEQTLQKHLLELQNTLKESQNLTHEKQEEISTLTTELNDASNALSELSTNNKDLQLKVASLEACHQDLSEALIHLENERKRSRDLENDRNAAKSVCDKLQFEIADVVLSNQKLALQLDDLKGVNDHLLAKLDDAETTRKLLETHLYDSRRSSDTLSAELGRLQLEYSSLHCELNESRADFEKEKADLIVKLHDSGEKFEVLEKTNEELRSELCNLRNQLSEALERVESGRNHARQLEDAQGFLEKQMESVQNSAKILEAEVNQLRTEKEETAQLLDERKSNLEVVEKEKKNLQTKIQELEETQLTLSTKNEELSKEINNLHTQLQNTNQSMEAKTQEARTLQDKINSLETILDKTQVSLERYQKEAEEQHSQNQKLTQTLQEKEKSFEENSRVLAHQKDELTLVLQDTQKQLDDLQKGIENLTDVRDGLETQLRDVRAQYEVTCADLDRMSIEKGITSEELRGTLERIRQIEEERGKLAANLDESVAKCRMMEEEMSTEVDTLRRQLKVADEALKVAEDELLELRNEKSRLEKELSDARARGDGLGKDIDELRSQNLTLEKELEESGKKVETLSKEKQDLVEKLEELEKEKAELLLQKNNNQENLKAMNTQLRSLDDTKNNLQVLLTEANKSLEEQKTHLSLIENESQEKHKELAKLEAEKSELEKQFQELKTAHEYVQTKLDLAEEQNREILKLNEDLQQTKVRCSDLEAEKTALTSDLQQSHLKNEECTTVVENLQRQLAEDRKTITDAKHAEEILQQKLLEMCSVLEDEQIGKQKAHEDLMNLKNQNQVLISKLEDYEIKCSRLEQKVTEVINNLILSNEESEAVRKNLEDERVMLSTKLAVLEENLEIADTKIMVILAQKSELEKEKIGYEEAMSKITEEKEEIQSRLESKMGLLMEKLVDLEGRLTDAEEKKSELEERVAKLAATNEEIFAEKQKTQESFTDVLKQKEELEEKLFLLQNENDSLLLKSTNQNEEMNATITNQREELEVKIRDSLKKLHDLQREKDDLQTQLSVLEIDYQQLKSNKATTDRQLEEVSVLSETLTAEAEKVRLQYQKSKKDLNETRDALMEIVNEKEELLKEVKKVSDEKAEMQKTLESVQQKLADLGTRSQEVETKLNQENEDLEKKKTQDESTIAKLESEIEATTKRAEAAEEELEFSRREILSLHEKMDRLSAEKSVLDKKIEVEEIISSENRDRAKALEETVQDYEITISGLKNVVDTNLEKLETLKEELSERRNKEIEIKNTVNKLLKANNVNSEDCGEDLKSFISARFEKIVAAKNEEEKRIMELENEIKELKNRNVTAVDLNSTVTEMVEKLHELVTENNDVSSMATLKARYDDVHVKVNNLLQVKQRLSEELRNVEDYKDELNKQVEALKVENATIYKAKTEVENTLKTEREKVETLRKELETRTKSVKTEKENILGVSTKPNKSREEDLKKENMMLKRKIVLAENAKNNLEKVLKELREDKKKGVALASPDALYKKLLQEYIQVKEENEKALKERDAKITELTRENEELKNVPMKPEDDKKLQNIREAYGNLMSVNSKMELEMVTLRKIIEERNNEVASLGHIKEAYERLLEENNKIITEVDTLKYKRTRDKEEFVRLLKKERESGDNREMKKIQEIRSEYEGKLEKMKDKMLKLYREEVNKKVKSLKDGQADTANMMKTVATLRSELFEAEQKIQMLEMEREMLRSSRDVRTIQLQSMSSITSISTNPERSSTLPRPSITKEFTISQRTSIGGLPNLPMEDEEDLFNDKYLTELKEGRCNPPADRNTRFSELAWRNSMVPPHLKSSYPAETQFVSPTRFKEDDLKTGNLELEDSLCKLLPGEKPRKKDFGTTSYKKPGPPTPSKNGGRLSLQGNEVHPMREHCEARTPKRSTPSRIKALFTGRNSSTLKDSESTGTPSRGRRLNIFRRPR